MKRIIFASCIALCLALPLFAADLQPIEGATPEILLGGAENLKIVSTAKEVTVFHVWKDTGQPGDQRLAPMDGLKCDASNPVSGLEQQKVVAAFSDPSNFGVDGSTFKIMADPNIILRFKADAGTVDIVVSFKSGEMTVYRDGKLVPRIFNKISKTFENKNSFTRDAGAAFIAIAKKAFPDSADIKALQVTMSTADLITYLQNAGAAYYDQFHAIPETPENYKVVAALLGANADKKVFIELSKSQLSPNGEVLDEWGTPLRFNFTQDTSVPIEALSAGKDKIFGTSDDIPAAKNP